MSLLLLYLFLVASRSFSTKDSVKTSVNKNETVHIDFPFSTSGITIKVNSTSENCPITVVGSTFITTPNEAFHDLSVKTNDYKEVFIRPSDVFNPAMASRMYLAVTTDANSDCTVIIETETGDTTKKETKGINHNDTMPNIYLIHAILIIITIIVTNYITTSLIRNVYV